MSIPSRASYWQLPPPAERKGFESLELKEGDVPKPGHKQVLVRVHAVSLNYRDLIIAKGTYPLHLKQGAVIPASDGAGEVVALGPEASLWKAGDRVTSIFNADHQKGSVPDAFEIQSGLGGGLDGMLAQYRVLPETALVRVPEHLSYEEAATLPCAALTAWNGMYGLSGTAFKSGETLVAEGTGGVSVFGAQFALAAGGHVVITSSSDEKLERVRKLVPQEHQKRLHLHNYKKNPDWEKKVLEVTKGVGAAHVLEVGGPGTLEKAFASIRPGGVVSDIGFVAQGEMPNVGGLVLSQRAIYRGVLVGSRELFEDMNRTIEAHEIRPLVDRVFPFDESRQAFEYQWSAAHAGKVVIRVA